MSTCNYYPKLPLLNPLAFFEAQKKTEGRKKCILKKEGPSSGHHSDLLMASHAGFNSVAQSTVVELSKVITPNMLAQNYLNLY
jgi:hypothetical protein